MSLEKEFIPYEQALSLKELGFDEPCFGYWNIDPGLPTKYLNPRCEPFKHDWCLPAPTFAQAFRFFREKYGLPSWIYTSNNKEYWYSILKDGRMLVRDYKPFETYEEAELACIVKLIELVKSK